MLSSRLAPVAPFFLTFLIAACDESAPPRNVILISVDTLRRDALAAFGGTGGPLPALDRLAAQSVRCERALTSAPWTLPAHASLLSGLYPDRHGATDQRVAMAEVDTLAGAFARRGYETAAFTGGGFLDANYGLGRGFERYESSPPREVGAEPAPELLARVERYLAARSDRRPLFLFVHTFAVHNYPHVRAEATAQGALAAPGEGADHDDYMDCVLGNASCATDAWSHLRALYRAEIELFDQVLARLRARLEEAGLWQDAYVVLLSDHGEGFEPERGRIHHGGRLHDDQLRIPLLVRGPDLEPRSDAQPVSIVDLMPTLLELAGAPVPDDLDGVSFAGRLRGGRGPAPRPLLAMEHCFWWDAGRRRGSPRISPLPRSLAIIDGERWYITSGRGDELYAVSDDGQHANLVADGADAAAMRARIGARPLPRPSTPSRRRDLMLDQQLHALGYADDGDDE